MDKKEFEKLLEENLNEGKFYKFEIANIFTDRNIKSMIPGDFKVAGCFSFSKLLGGFL